MKEAVILGCQMISDSEPLQDTTLKTGVRDARTVCRTETAVTTLIPVSIPIRRRRFGECESGVGSKGTRTRLGSKTKVSNTLLKSDVTRRDHVYIVMDPMNAGSRIVNFIVNFIRDGTVFA